MPIYRAFLAFLLGCILVGYLPVSVAGEGSHAAYLELSGRAEILEDKTGGLALGDIVQPELAQQFRPFSGAGSVNLGYSASVWWLRLSLPALPAGSSPDYLLEIGFPTLDQIQVFSPDPKSAQSFVAQTGGDTLPQNERPVAHRNFVFPVHLLAGQENVVYLRIRSEGTLTLPLRLWRASALAEHDQVVYGAHALYLGMLLGLGLYNLLLWASLRESIYLTYVVFVLAMATAQLALNGLGYQFIWPDELWWQRISLNSAFALAGMFGAVFTRQFLRSGVTPWYFNRLLTGFVVAFALLALAPLFLPYRPTAVATSLVGVFFALVAVVSGVVSLRSGNPGARFFLLAWLALLLGVALMGLRNMALIPTNFVSVNGIQIGSAFEILLLSFALADRIQYLRREKDAATAAALISEKARVEDLEQSEHLLEERVAERTRELAEANLRLQESEARMTNLAQHDPLTGLANRNLLFDRLEHAMQRAAREQSRCAVLLIDLDGFKEINDTFGHQCGDIVLCEVAARLQQQVRVSDTVARLGGDEFVVVLESIGKPESYLGVAEKILLALVEPILCSGDAIRSGGSIGIALWPENGEEPSQLLLAADRAMYCAKHDGRGRIVVAPDQAPRV